MNRALKNELALISGIAAGSLLLTKNKKMGVALSALALGLKLLPSKPTLHFRNRSVIITGGSRGLGLALAQEFLNEGCSVALLARDQDELLQAQSLLKQKTGLSPFIYVCDVTNPLHLSEAFMQVHAEFGEIDILVNNAGTVMSAPIEAMDPKDYASLMNVHFFGVQNACDLLIPYFKQKGEGYIVNISSIGGKIPIPHLSPYTASKFALSGYSHSLAVELAQHGIQVTTVHPGLMRTGSPVQGIFKGDAEKEYAWFAISDNTPGLSISVQSAAKQILQGVRFGQRELVISLPAKVATLSFGLFPELTSRLLSFANGFLPKGLSKKYHSGAASKHWIESKISPLKNFQKKLQREYNQQETYF